MKTVMIVAAIFTMATIQCVQADMNQHLWTSKDAIPLDANGKPDLYAKGWESLVLPNKQQTGEIWVGDNNGTIIARTEMTDAKPVFKGEEGFSSPIPPEILEKIKAGNAVFFENKKP
jgi:hypothetical protein